MTEQQRRCPYCHEDRDGYIKPLDKNCHMYVWCGLFVSCFGLHYGYHLSLSAKGWHGEVEINYCPMCGRDLKEQDDA